MRSRVVRSLVVACSLLLALPKGWCCMIAAQPQPPTAASTPTAPADAELCCPCCRHQTPTSSPDRQPTQKSPTDSHGVCCCADRHATIPLSFSVEQSDTGFFTLLPVLGGVPACDALTDGMVVSDLPPPTSQLHVLHCVWLC